MLALQTMILLLVFMNDFEFAVNLVRQSISDGLGFLPPVINGFQVLAKSRSLSNHALRELCLYLILVILYHSDHYLSNLINLLILQLVVS